MNNNVDTERRASYLIDPANTNVERPRLNGVTPALRSGVKYFVVQLPSKHFGGTRDGLLDCKNDAIAQSSVSALFVLLHVSNNPRLMLRQPAEDTSEGGAAAAAQAARKGPAEPDNSIFRKDAHSPDSISGKSYIDRVETYFERVMNYDGREIIAYRWWFFFPDTSLDPNQGIECLMAGNAKAQAKEAQQMMGKKRYRGNGGSGHTPWQKAYETVASRPDFVKQYLCSITSSEFVTKNSAMHLNLTNDDNPANLFSCLTIDKATSNLVDETVIAKTRDELSRGKGIAVNAGSIVDTIVNDRRGDVNKQLSAVSYYEATRAGGERCIRFPLPEHVFRIRADEASAALAYVCNFPHRPIAEFPNQSRMSPGEVVILRKSQQRDAISFYEARAMSNGYDDDDDTDASRDAFVKLRRRTNAVYKRAFEAAKATDPDELNRIAYEIRAYCFLTREEKAAHPEYEKWHEELWHAWDDTFSPTNTDVNKRIRAVAEFGSRIRETARDSGKAPSFVNFERAVVDPTLSPFGNMKAVRMRNYEKVYATYSLHTMIDLLFTSAMTTYYHPFDMKVNVWLTGGAEVGKSHVGFTLLRKLCIPDTAELVTRETNQSQNTSTNMDSTISWTDEMNSEKVGIGPNGKSVGGTGPSEMKSLMTSGIVSVRDFHRTESGKRQMKTTTSYRRCTTHVATNDNASAIPKELRTRTLCVDCHKVRRAYRSVPEIELSQAIFTKTTFADESPAMASENFFHQKMQYFVCLVEKLIEVRLMRDVSTTVAQTCFEEMNTFLEERGYDIGGIRNVKRLTMLARVNTIMNAIYIVFCTPHVFQSEDHPFSPRDVLLLEPYLVANEEIAIYSFTAALSNVVNSLEPAAVSTLARECAGYEANNVGLSMNVSSSSSSLATTKKADEFDSVTGSKTTKYWTKENGITFAADPDTGETDYNYLFVKFDARFFTVDEYVHKAAVIVSGALALKNSVTTSVRGVEDIFVAMKDRQMKCTTSWNGFNKTEELRIPRYMNLMTVNLNAGGILLLRHFVNVQSQTTTLGLEAISAIQHRFTRPQRVVTALTYVNEPQGKSEPKRIIVPHILRVHDLVPKPSRIRTFSSLCALDRTEYDETCDDDPRIPKAPRNLIYALNVDMELIESKRHWNLCGYRQSMVKQRLEAALPSSYCASYFDRFKSKNVGCYPFDALNEYVAAEETRISVKSSATVLRDYWETNSGAVQEYARTVLNDSIRLEVEKMMDDDDKKSTSFLDDEKRNKKPETAYELAIKNAHERKALSSSSTSFFRASKTTVIIDDDDDATILK